MRRLLLLTLVLVSLWAIAVCQNDDDKNALDKIFEINQIDGDGQSTFSSLPTLFEGDIVRTKRLDKEVEEFKEAAKKGGSPYDAIARGQWPGGVIPYTFNRRFSGHNNVRAAIADYTKHTCIKWVRRTNQRDYVEFFNGGGCYSMIGRQGGRQQISLGRGCLQHGIVIHEMMHCAGFFHEQSRLDRERYISIVWRNINSRMQYNFQKYRAGQASTLGEPYDKTSVMHYGNYAFSINGQKTIISRANSNERLGQRRGFSRIDINQLNKYYNCRGTTRTTKRPVVTRPPQPSGCSDNYPFCGDLKSRWCSNSWVTANCKKACNRCAGACANKNQYCDAWAKLGYCDNNTYKGYMKDKCKKSCRAC